MRDSARVVPVAALGSTSNANDAQVAFLSNSQFTYVAKMTGIPVISGLLTEGLGPPPPNAQVIVILSGIPTRTVCTGLSGHRNAG
eukprot:350255-Chlamydomonas_euryale.AAC.40